MLKYFDRTFFRFLLAFIAVICFSMIVFYVTTAVEQENSGQLCCALEN